LLFFLFFYILWQILVKSAFVEYFISALLKNFCVNLKLS